MIRVRRGPTGGTMHIVCDLCGRRSRSALVMATAPIRDLEGALLTLRAAVRRNERWWIAGDRAVCRLCWKRIFSEQP